jgi:hemerythrin
MKTYSGFFGRVPMMQHSLASLVQWNDRVATGIPMIDAQDQSIFALVGEIDDLWSHGAGMDPLRGIADQSQRLLQSHFHSEERMLAEVGYPDLAQHAALHREILDDLASIRAQMDGGGGISPACAGLRLSNFILGVTLGHIIHADREYCGYITEESSRQSTGCA